MQEPQQDFIHVETAIQGLPFEDGAKGDRLGSSQHREFTFATPADQKPLKRFQDATDTAIRATRTLGNEPNTAVMGSKNLEQQARFAVIAMMQDKSGLMVDAHRQISSV